MIGYDRAQTRFIEINRKISSETVLIAAIFSTSCSVIRGLLMTPAETTLLESRTRIASRFTITFHRQFHPVTRVHEHHARISETRSFETSPLSILSLSMIR